MSSMIRVENITILTNVLPVSVDYEEDKDVSSLSSHDTVGKSDIAQPVEEDW